jgi:NAD(P)-dependent dehydrogenase (short-subunit alcohol dehydrogenase family)
MTGRTLEGRTALITGAGRGLGKAMAEGLAARGAKIALVDLERDVLAAAAADVETAGGQGCALVLPADVTDSQRAAEVVEETISSFGSLDILINDAAMGPQFFTEDFTGDGPRFWEVDNDLWLRVLTVNAFGPQLMASAVVPHMVDQGWGRIINVTTSLDTMFLPGCGAYGPSKASLEANTHIMANDLGGTGVTANVLIPGGPANTRMITEATGIPREDLIQPEVMQAPSVWLCTDEANDTSGMRFIAALWDENQPLAKRLEQAGAPTAWAQIPSKAIRPDSVASLDR